MFSVKLSFILSTFFIVLGTALTVSAQDTCNDALLNKPVITQHELKGVAALTIEKGDQEPSDEQYATIRDVLVHASEMGFNTWRAFFNAYEVKSLLAMSSSDPNQLLDFGCQQGLTFVADTVEAVVPKLNDEDLKAYIQGLETLGAKALVFNDADRFSLDDLNTMVSRIRAISALPLIASLRGSANRSDYAMFNFLEAQTFGTTQDFSHFMAQPFDLYCLDARQTMTVSSLEERGQMILSAKPRAIFYYTDKAADWLAMPHDEVATLTNIIERWKAIV